MCVISKSSMYKGIQRVASGHSKVSINSCEATGRFTTPFGVQTITVSRDKIITAGKEVLKACS